jgi:hypothetical protein
MQAARGWMKSEEVLGGFLEAFFQFFEAVEP